MLKYNGASFSNKAKLKDYLQSESLFIERGTLHFCKEKIPATAFTYNLDTVKAAIIERILARFKDEVNIYPHDGLIRIMVNGILVAERLSMTLEEIQNVHI